MIRPYRPDAEYFSDEHCHINELDNSGADESCSIARARVEPGAATHLHALRGTIERYVILEGEGRVEIGGEQPATLRPLDVAIVPAGASQRIINTGQGDLVFLCVCTPRFRPEHYIRLEG